MRVLCAFLLVLPLVMGSTQLEDIVVEARTSFEGLASGILGDGDFTLDEACFPVSLAGDVEALFKGTFDAISHQRYYEILASYMKAKNLIAEVSETCGFETIAEQFYKQCVTRSGCDLSNIGSNLQQRSGQLAEMVMHVYELRSSMFTQSVQGDKAHREIHYVIGEIIAMAISTEETTLLRRSSEGVSDDELEEDIEVIELFLQGILKGLSKDGKSLGKCYTQILGDVDEVMLVIDTFAKILENKIDYGMMPLLLIKIHGHANATVRDCRLAALLEALFDFSAIGRNISVHSGELTTVVPSLTMQLVNHRYESVGILIGKTIKLVSEYYVD